MTALGDLDLEVLLPAVRREHLRVGAGGQAQQDVLEVVPGVDPGGLRGHQQAHQDCRRLAAAFTLKEEPVLPPVRERPQRPLGGVVRDRQPAVIEIAQQRRPLVTRIGDRTPQR